MEYLTLLLNKLIYGDNTQNYLTMDPRELTHRQCTTAIAITALAWLVLDRVLHFALQGWLYRKLYPNGVPSFEKGQQEASAAVTDAVTKLVSVIHNVIQIPIAVYVLLDSNITYDPIYAHTHLSTVMCLISSGYFLYDLVIVLWRFQREGAGFLVHAVCCLFVYGYAVYSLYLHYFGAGFLLWELSTPLLHYRWFLYKTNAANSKEYFRVGVALVVVFFLCRPVWGTWLSYKFFIDTEFELQQQRPDGFPASGIWAYRVANVALNLLNYFWFCKLASKAVQQLIGGDKEKEKNKSHAGKMG